MIGPVVVPPGDSGQGMITYIKMDDADQIVNKAIACGKRNKFQPLAVTVVDAAGNMIVHKRMDGCPTVGFPEFATAKAYTCISMKMSSRNFRDKFAWGGYLRGCYDSTGLVYRFLQHEYLHMNHIVAFANHRMMPCPGGVLIKNKKGVVIGAVGVSGATFANEDEYCAIVGVAETNPQLKLSPDFDLCKTNRDGYYFYKGQLRKKRYNTQSAHFA